VVKRWLRAQADKHKGRRKKARWAMLTPSSEVCLELKGGFVSLSGMPVASFKETRSRDLHELGFTYRSAWRMRRRDHRIHCFAPALEQRISIDIDCYVDVFGE